MSKDTPDHHDAEIVLRLYELRRETVMRDARDTINAQFWPRTFEDVLALTKRDHHLNRPFRQVGSYWEMVYGMVKHGIVNAEYFLESNGEGFFLFAKILPFLQQFVQDRFEVSQRRIRALNQLRQAIQRGGSDEDLKRAIRDFDAADADFQSNQEKFLSSVDPLLDARQQAKLRIFQVMADNRMRQLLTSIRNPNRGQ